MKNKFQVSSLLSTILMHKSKTLTENLNFSCANFKLGWKLLRRFRNPSSLWLWLFKLMYMVKKHMIWLATQVFLFYSEALSMWNQITKKMQITQQHYKSKLKHTYRIKEIIVKGKIKIMSLQKKIVRKINSANTVQRSHQRYWYSLSVFIANFEQWSATSYV